MLAGTIALHTCILHCCILYHSLSGVNKKVIIMSFYFTCRFKTIAKHKTAYYSFYLPVALAMHMVSTIYLCIHRYHY